MGLCREEENQLFNMVQAGISDETPIMMLVSLQKDIESSDLVFRTIQSLADIQMKILTCRDDNYGTGKNYMLLCIIFKRFLEPKRFNI